MKVEHGFICEKFEAKAYKDGEILIYATVKLEDLLEGLDWNTIKLFYKEELQEELDNAYDEGVRDERNSNYDERNPKHFLNSII